MKKKLLMSFTLVFPSQLNMNVSAKLRYMILNRNDMANTMNKKRVEVFYIMEDDTIITVTVYVFYGKWEEIK